MWPFKKIIAAAVAVGIKSPPKDITIRHRDNNWLILNTEKAEAWWEKWKETITDKIMRDFSDAESSRADFKAMVHFRADLDGLTVEAY